MASKNRDITIKHVAHELGLELKLVRDVLREASGIKAPKDQLDKIFRAARKLGYDFKKLKIGKRMQYRKETLEEVLEKVEENKSWNRDDVLKLLKESLALVDRVHRRVFKEEFGESPS